MDAGVRTGEKAMLTLRSILKTAEFERKMAAAEAAIPRQGDRMSEIETVIRMLRRNVEAAPKMRLHFAREVMKASGSPDEPYARHDLAYADRLAAESETALALLEHSTDEIERLRAAMKPLAIYADVCAAILKDTHPGKAASLSQRVAAAHAALSPSPSQEGKPTPSRL
jgi:hypothetical protein